jgi:hypothetical protein
MKGLEQTVPPFAGFIKRRFGKGFLSFQQNQFLFYGIFGDIILLFAQL